MKYTQVGPPWGDVVSPALYPDLVESGGLSQSLRRLLPADVTVEEECVSGKVGPSSAFIRILQEPAASFTAQCWENLEKGLREEARFMEEKGKRSIMSELIPLVAEAAKRPELRQLRPFTSMFWLCLSRTTMFPWVTVKCTARPIGNGRFRISNGSWGVKSDGDRILGEGDAVQAADILVANLPPNCGPAIHGTAEDWKEQGGQ